MSSKKYTLSRGLTLGEWRKVSNLEDGEFFKAMEEVAKPLILCNGEPIADFDDHPFRLIASAVKRLVDEATEPLEKADFFS